MGVQGEGEGRASHEAARAWGGMGRYGEACAGGLLELGAGGHAVTEAAAEGAALLVVVVAAVELLVHRVDDGREHLIGGRGGGRGRGGVRGRGRGGYAGEGEGEWGRPWWRAPGSGAD